MNRQIRELAEEATRRYDRLGDEIPFAQPDLNIFAQLIIRECCSIVLEKTAHSATVVEAIEQRFGIEQ